MNELEYITSVLEERIHDCSEFIISGNCKDIESYRHLTGQLIAYEDIKIQIKDLQKKLNDL
jgi:hypothetical protein|tara:strand:+ start:596 stop:778 length:183 start_codon:yes stop_codon:yes gene_type:complete